MAEAKRQLLRAMQAARALSTEHFRPERIRCGPELVERYLEELRARQHCGPLPHRYVELPVYAGLPVCADVALRPDEIVVDFDLSVGDNEGATSR